MVSYGDGAGLASRYITYAPPLGYEDLGKTAPEKYYLFYGANSMHLGDRNGSPDDWAVKIAEKFFSPFGGWD